jgi:negative regulator of sigma E activity
MKDDYLWDKSGRPDPEIQQLEEVLGTLRYQPKPLRFEPNPLKQRRNYFPLLAIAATVLVALLTGGLWLQLQTADASIPAVAITEPTNSILQPAPPRINPPLSVSTNSPKKRTLVVRNRREREEALAAKQQLILALRLASEKLNTAYRRTQTPPQIKNQHKAG